MEKPPTPSTDAWWALFNVVFCPWPCALFAAFCVCTASPRSRWCNCASTSVGLAVVVAVLRFSAKCGGPVYADETYEIHPCFSASETLASIYSMSFNLHSAVIDATYNLAIN